MLLFLAEATSAQGIRAVRPGNLGNPLLEGALRHVQLLEVTESSPPRLRFATSTTAGIALFERCLEDRTPLTDPVAFVDTAGGVLPWPTWERPVPWKLVACGDELRLVSLDQRDQALSIRHFPDGDHLARLDGVASFEDARGSGDVLEVLVRRGEHLEMISVGARHGEFEVDRLHGPCPEEWTACFVRAPAGEPTIPTVIMSGRGAHGLTVERLDVRTGRHDAARLGSTLWPGSDIRVAARRDGDTDRIALALPHHLGGFGRVVSMSLALDEFRLDPHTFWPGSQPTKREAQGPLLGRGHAPVFAGDADGDGSVDVVAAFHTWLGEGIEVLSPTKRRHIESLKSPMLPYRIPSSLSISPCGRYLLAAGGTTSYPESMWNEACAMVYRIDGSIELVSCFLAPSTFARTTRSGR